MTALRNYYLKYLPYHAYLTELMFTRTHTTTTIESSPPWWMVRGGDVGTNHC